MFSVGDTVEVVANIKNNSYACDELIGAVGTVIEAEYFDAELVEDECNAKFCISFEEIYGNEEFYDNTWRHDSDNPFCRWVLENEIQLVSPMESFEDELLKLLGGSTE